MSDVIGHGFVAIAALRLLRAEARGDPSWPTHLITGWVLAWSLLIRVSSGLFLPLFGVLRVAAAPPSRLAGTGVPALSRTGILLAGVLPCLGVYAYLVLTHGPRNFLTTYFSFSQDNAASLDRLARLPHNLTIWAQPHLRGVRPRSPPWPAASAPSWRAGDAPESWSGSRPPVCFSTAPR